MKRNWFRKILGGLSFTSALFVFQACYGTGPDMERDLLLEGLVKAKTSGLPIPGIKVSIPDYMQYQLTDESGKFSFYAGHTGEMTVLFEDLDSTQNGSFVSRDTVFRSYEEKVYLNIGLEEK